jgi:hypothetical protein
MNGHYPGRDQLVDVGHKAVYSFVTGAVSDRLVPLAPDRAPDGTAGSRRGVPGAAAHRG